MYNWPVTLISWNCRSKIWRQFPRLRLSVPPPPPCMSACDLKTYVRPGGSYPLVSPLSLLTLRKHQGGRGGGGSPSSSTTTPPTPLQIWSLPVARDKYSELPSGVRRPVMVHYLADLDSIQREEDIAVTIVTAILEDMTMQLLLHRKYWVWYGSTWCMLRKGKEERSQTDYWWW